ncbi:hypothetical protein IVB30_02815 [Bradyrhizobium sp. 200]|uniref:hypothetical protein n=1 Tax=Bradyrhizobium sp. 200 TaxID=2782665 RepID=UPI001FFFF5AC|nr:hypothetical protein [Bradyrhizobium sp. 200]UPJ50382.1 hypothetical protein IVB30_02815 [Bradyrhizobium sp. 200]
MTGHIASNSQIVDLIHVLPDPVEYVRNVIGNFVTHRYEPETSRVRIGIKGMGVAPNYKIEEPSFLHPLTIGTYSFEMTVTPARTFSGRSHREMSELDDCERHDENWSARTMTFAELKTLLGSLAQSDSKH